MSRLDIETIEQTLVIMRRDDNNKITDRHELALLEYRKNARNEIEMPILPEENRKLFAVLPLPEGIFIEKEKLTGEEQKEVKRRPEVFDIENPYGIERVIAVYSHHMKLFFIMGTRRKVLHSLLRMNMVVRHVGLSQHHLTIDAFIYAENNYGIKVEDMFFSLDFIPSGKHYKVPVEKTSLSRWGKYRKRYYFHMSMSLDQFVEEAKLGGTPMCVWVKVDGVYVKYRFTRKFNNKRGRIKENKEYYVPTKSIYAGNYALQIRRDFDGHYMFIKRPMEEREHSAYFRFMESMLVTGTLFYTGKLFKKIRKKNINLFYEKLSEKAEEGTYELFQRCDHEGDAKCYFILDKNSADYKRIGGEHNVVAKFSLKYYYLIFNVDYFISTEAPVHLTLMDENNRFVRFNLCKHPFIFLQHGVTYLKPQGARSTFSVGKAGEPAYIVVNSDKEGEAVSRMLGTPEERNLKTGMMIFDYCKYQHMNAASPDKIVIMLTWKPYENFIEDFRDSTYYQDTMAIYHMLIQHVDPSQIIIVPHPKVVDGLSETVGADLIWKDPISEVLPHAKLLITDYSSVCYNTFYQGGGVVFYQPDLEMYETYMKMPLVPEADEYIGYRTFDITALEETITPGLKNSQINLDYFRTPEFEQRYEAINEFHDGKNTERIYQFLKEQHIV